MIHSFSRAGRHHAQRGEACQDAVRSAESPEWVAIAAADGVTACRHGKEGAQIACEAVLRALLRQGDRLWEYEEKKLSYLIVEQVLFELERHAPDGNVGEYACTLAFACIRRRDGRMLLWNLGDGAALVIPAGGHAQLMLPPRRYGGRSCQVTTQQAWRAAAVRTGRLNYGDQVMLCTDGALGRIFPLTEALRQSDYPQADRLLEQSGEWDDMSYILWKHQ